MNNLSADMSSSGGTADCDGNGVSFLLQRVPCWMVTVDGRSDDTPTSPAPQFRTHFLLPGFLEG